MTTIKVGNSEHGLKFNLRAAKVYKELTGEDVTDMSGIAGIGEFIYACIFAHYKSDGKDCPITLDDVFDGLDLNDSAKAIAALMPKSDEPGK